MDVYGECLIRTMTTRGVVYVTFTPLMGITPFVQEFLDAARRGGQIPY
jgi:phage terminase large subunit-like protein